MKTSRSPFRSVVDRLLFGIALSSLAWSALHAEETGEDAEKSPVHISRDAHGVVVLAVDTETQELIKLSVQAVDAMNLRPIVIAYGKLEEDPSEAFTLRAPVAGVLRTLTERSWPGIGDRVESNVILGYVEPRYTALELADVQARRMDAQAEVDERMADLDAARASFENKSRLNADGGLVSARSMEEARAKFKSGEARLEAAKQKADVYEALIMGRSQTSALFPIRTFGHGEVVEILAHPGEVVDAGQVLLRLARFDSLIARVALSIGEHVGPTLSAAQITVVGGEDRLFMGEPIGPGPATDPRTNGQSLLYRIRLSEADELRPGVPVFAFVPTTGTDVNGILIPRSALLRHGGRTWVYVEASEDRFERRDVVLHSPTTQGWFATSGVSAGEKVITEGAQMLLSEELKAQIESEEEVRE